MGRGGHLAALVLASIALGGPLAACERKPSLAPVSVIKVITSDLAPALSEAGLDAAATAGLAKGALASAGFAFDEGARRSYRASLEVVAFSFGRPVDGGTPSAEIVLELQIEPSWAAGQAMRQGGRASVPLAGARRGAAWSEALRLAAGEAAAALALDVRAGQKPTEALVADLSAGDPRARERAVRALAARGARRAVGALVDRVRDPDRAVASAAVDALAAFKDPASALALIEAAQAGDSSTTLRLIPVIVEIGGPDVEGYLLTLESGHADPVVRRAAAEARPKVRAAGPPVGGVNR